MQSVAAGGYDEEKTYSPFTEEQLAEMRNALQENANETIAETSQVSIQDIPSWIPGLPSAIPFNWCLKNIPFANDICAIANSPVQTGSFECNGVTYAGVTVSGGVAAGPSVSIEGENFTGDIENEVNVEVLYDRSISCAALKFSSGPVEGCTGLECPPEIPSPTDSITELANALYDTSYDLAEDMYQSIGYVPPSHVLAGTAVVFAVMIGFALASPVP